MQATESIVKLFTEWEIQLLLLLSFTLQLFLFFAGSLRRCSYSGFLRVCNWIAYLGADFVAVYALGYLSRHNEDDETRGTEPLAAFFWAPFLLIHLGGQDTISALSMEDNNLWLRHLLNLVVQVILALYVFWKSIGRLKNAELLASGVLVFVAGIIKYVERIWCLKRGSLAGLANTDEVDPRNVGVDPGGYASTLIGAVTTMRFAIQVFGSSVDSRYNVSFNDPDQMDQIVIATRLLLGLMYDELYTKARVLRTWSFMIFRLISQISFVLAFAVFHHSSIVVEQQGGRYMKADVAITYSLFIGGVFVEVCSVLNSMMSPWTWKMLKDHKWERLARLSWLVLSSDIGWPEKKQRWPCSFGQYNFLSWLTDGHPPQAKRRRRTLCQGVMTVVRRAFVDVMGVNRKKLFWMSKVLDTWYIDADQVVIDKYVAREIVRLTEEHELITPTREWPNLAPVLMYGVLDWEDNFGKVIVHMHVLTELHLPSYDDDDHMMADDEDDGAFGMAQICRKLSNYMMYLLVSNPSVLPLTTSSERVLETCHKDESSVVGRMGHYNKHYLHPSKETVEEMVYMWTRLLLYAAGKSRPSVHASQLASSGGELITLAWLLMVLHQLGDYRGTRLGTIVTSFTDTRDVYAFNMVARTNENAAAGTSNPSRAS
uniref:Uncharacterized protein n=1 Tax=Avena sativa TaxID=4498 RepID=A0ACD5XJH5_AVESA